MTTRYGWLLLTFRAMLVGKEVGTKSDGGNEEEIEKGGGRGAGNKGDAWLALVAQAKCDDKVTSFPAWAKN